MLCDHFSDHRDVMNSVKSVSDNFESITGSVIKDLFLYGWFGENKNKVTLETTITINIGNFKRFFGFLFEEHFISE